MGVIISKFDAQKTQAGFPLKCSEDLGEVDFFYFETHPNISPIKTGTKQN